jgi:hypothetical protein
MMLFCAGKRHIFGGTDEKKSIASDIAGKSVGQ